MPNQNIHIPLLTAVLGIGILSGTALYAEHPRDPGPAERQGIDESRVVTNPDITGGFYDDRYQRDDWYYDFYDSPDHFRRSAGSMNQRPDEATATMTDAAHPVLKHQTPPQSEPSAAYDQYYAEPWFYDQRDPLYGMPEAGLDQSEGNVIKGTVKATKQVRNRSTGDQNTVVLLTTTDRRQITADLGSSRRTMDMALTQGDLIQVAGPWEKVGPYSVLMAQQVKTDAKRVSLHRQTGSTMAERKVEGRIQQFRDIRTNRGAELHRTAAVQTLDGRIAIVDLGSDSRDQRLGRAATGDRMVAHGRVIHVGNYPVLLANRVAINDGAPIEVTRTTEPVKYSPGTGGRTENCLGAGCDNQPLNQGESGRSHNNVMDGTMR